ncbi:MAG: agmatinase family protein [Patescibacteria group bacterium]
MSAQKRPALPFDPNAAALPGSGIFGLPSTLKDSKVIVLPVPFDATTSYGGGAASAPEAIMAASHQIDLFDLQTGKPYATGISMLRIPQAILSRNAAARRQAKAVIAAGGVVTKSKRLLTNLRFVNQTSAEVNAWVYGQTQEILAKGKIVMTLGGDHSVPFGAINAYTERCPGLGILHIDAHCDLREAYEGFTWSHASIFHNVMTRLNVKKLVQVGIRDLSAGENDFVEKHRNRITLFGDHELQGLLFGGSRWKHICEEIVGELPKQVYLSVDIDGLDPSLCPHTGTPVPGGLSFPQFTELLATVVESGRTIVGGDLCEVAPGPAGDEWDANVGARVLYKMIGYTLMTRA